jgi:hypothetical protein
VATDWKRFQDALHAWIVRSTGLREGQVIFADQNAPAPRLEAEDTFSSGEVTLFGDAGTPIPNGRVIEAEGSGNAYELLADATLTEAEEWEPFTLYSRGDVVRGLSGGLFLALTEGESQEGTELVEPDPPTDVVVDGAINWKLMGSGDAYARVPVRAKEGGPITDAADLLSVIPESSAVPGWDYVWNDAPTAQGVSYPLTTDYVTISLGGAKRLGGPPGVQIRWLGKDAPRNQEVELKAETLAEFPVRLQAYSKETTGNSSARAYLEAAQASLQLPSFREQINDAGLGILEVGDIQVINAAYAAQIEGRAAMDLRLGYRQTATEKVGYIASVTLEDESTSEQFTVPKRG